MALFNYNDRPYSHKLWDTKCHFCRCQYRFPCETNTCGQGTIDHVGTISVGYPLI